MSTATDPRTDARAAVERWFSDRGWTPAAFQTATWAAYARGASGLIHSDTGSGKSLAAWLGPVMEGLARGGGGAGLKVLWITPLRALATDTVEHLRDPVEALGLHWRVEKRTGDTGQAARARQRRSPPDALVTTPESLSLLLSYRDARRHLGGVGAVIVDEWHELLGTKRGVQLELALAWLRALNPGLRTWGLSATLGNLEEARAVLLGPDAGDSELIEGPRERDVRIRGLLPRPGTRFPWAGHLGINLIEPVLDYLDEARSCLLFTNTRSQAELWHEALIARRPDWLEGIALHHGSIDRRLRDRVEDGLRGGAFRCVVATSSLDLGVDFSPVDRVVQVGSPKGVARLLQRAGRCGHQPGVPSEVLCVPSHAFELVEIAAARRAQALGRIESRTPLTRCLDVLAQHLVTLATGDGFEPEATLAQVRRTHAFAELTGDEWQWVLTFISRGGAVLENYPQFHRVSTEGNRYRVTDRTIASRHRMAIGTITSDPMMAVKYLNGARIGSVEENFIARLKPGDRFLFSGRTLELVRVRDLTAYVRRAGGTRREVPRWQGGRLPLSTELADTVREILEEVRRGAYADPETRAASPVLELQQRWSVLPAPDELLVEATRSREGAHLFLFPFAGRLAHEGLAALLAWRIGQSRPATFSLSVNDYGLELLTPEPLELDPAALRAALTPDGLAADLAACTNAGELARRRFRDIARIAGLVFQGYPGKGKSARQVQASSGLIFDTLTRYDPGHRLLGQAQREVLESQLEYRRLATVLGRIADARLVYRKTERLTPLAFPLWAERLRNRLTTESWEARIERMVAHLEKAADR